MTPSPDRPGGWTFGQAIVLVVAAALLSPVSPIVLVTLPVAVFLLAYRPRSTLSLALAALLLVGVFGGVAVERTPLWYAERAWTLIIAGGFVGFGLIDRDSRTLSRSMGALAVAMLFFAVGGMVYPDLLAELDWSVRGQLERAALSAYQLLAGGGTAWVGVAEALEDVLGIQQTIYPALLGLSSMAALAVGWYVLERLSGVAASLAPFREFRFADQLVWLLVAGLVLFLLPLPELASRLGENAMAFMGGLYLLRGAAILLWLGAALATSAWVGLAWALIALLLYPIAAGAALVMGLSDTWLDLRGRMAAAPEDGEGA